MTPTEFMDAVRWLTFEGLRLLLVFLICVAVYLIFVGFAVSADNLPRCLSMRQARSLYPTTHLYWYYDDGDKCWSNRRGGPPRQRRERPIINDPPEPVVKLKSVKWYPREFEPAAPLDPPHLIDLAEPPPDCCWPDLSEFDKRWTGVPNETDANGGEIK